MKKTGAVFLLLLFVLLVCVCGATQSLEVPESSAENNSETETIRTERKVPLEYTNHGPDFDFEEQMESLMELEWYDNVNVGMISLDLPRGFREWLYPENTDEDSREIHCYQQGERDPDAMAVSVYRQEERTLESFSSDFERKGYEIYENETFVTENVGDAVYYCYRGHMTDTRLNSAAFYKTYVYAFYNVQKDLITLQVDIPDKWETDCGDMVSHMFESIVLPPRRFPDHDFLSSEENYNLCYECRREGSYQRLYDVLQEYVSGPDVQENDSAYAFLEVLEKIMPYVDAVSVKYDEIEEHGIITYRGVEEISSSIHLVPSVLTTRNDVSVTVGFVNSGWLFFDGIIITAEPQNYSIPVDYDDRHDEILGGAQIKETCKPWGLERYLDDILQKENPMIRFENRHDEKQLEYPLSDSELSAIRTVREFATIGGDLGDILNDYNESVRNQ